jgi:glucose-1-phosphate cytidylyltransferase
MKIYSQYGYNEFVIALGFKGNIIRDYFLNYKYYNNDFTMTIGKCDNIIVHDKVEEENWKITLVETGEKTMTGARIKKCEKYIEENNFMLSYGDGLADINIEDLVEYHIEKDKIGTITGVNPPSRFGELVIENSKVIEFKEKPKLESKNGEINGGFMIFKKEFFNYLTDDANCILEHAPLENLANNRELMVYHHHSFWQSMDTYRDYLLLNDMYNKGNTPWINRK